MHDGRRILIIKPSSLGDIVHALPVLATLRTAYPKAHIAWLVKQQWTGLLERVEGLDRIWAVDSGISGWVSLVPQLRKAGFDLVLDLQGLFRSGAMAWMTGCPRRVGFANGREGSPMFYSTRVDVPAADMHAVDRYLLLAEAVGAGHDGAPEFHLRPLPADRDEIGALLSRHGVAPDTRWIAMAVSARWPTKRWPPDLFAQTADRLQESLAPIVLIGGPDDRSDALAVASLMRRAPVDLTGSTPPGLLPALLGSASLLVTNDSGPMYIAAVMDTPVVALFGPTSPVRTGPYGDRHRVLRSGISCSPCFSRTCRNPVQLECLHAISPMMVIDAALEMAK